MREPPILSERDLIAIGKALAEPRRAAMLRAIAAAGTLPCQELLAAHTVSAATLSHHMRELEASGLVEILRDGRFALLRLRADTMRAYLRQLERAFLPAP